MATISEALAIAIRHHQAGRLQAAEHIYRQILAVEPNHADAWHLLGVINAQAGNHQLAVEYFYRALSVKPDFAMANNNLGNSLKEQGKLDEAIACYRRALELKPGLDLARNNLGNALKEQGKSDEAVACYRRALELNPNLAEAHCNLGNALNDQGNLGEAIACYRRALQLNPDFALAHGNLGNVLKTQEKLDEAVACYRRALDLDPDYAPAHNNLGIALDGQGKVDEALACYCGALKLKPDYADAHWNQSLLLLMSGDFERGWPEYEWRWKAKQTPRGDFSQARWDGQSLVGRTILLHAEQGLGDTIQFVRYAALVKHHGGTVIVECPRPLLPLLATCAGIDRLLARGDELPAFDIQAPLLSLPGIFHTTLRDIPASIPYLFADGNLLERWRRELSDIPGFRIGIAWQGDPKHVNDHNRSIPLSCFEPLARCSGFRLVSLQKGAGVEQLQHAAERFAITELGSRLEDFRDTAAVLKNLDLVITCDSALAHLAGALGVPVWVAIPLVPDWRWLLGRSDCPWYPTMRLFRQDRQGDWQGVFRKMVVALDEQMAGQVIRPNKQS